MKIGPNVRSCWYKKNIVVDIYYKQGYVKQMKHEQMIMNLFVTN